MAVHEQAVMISETADWSAQAGYTIRRTYLCRADTPMEAVINARSKPGPGLPVQSAVASPANQRDSRTHWHVDLTYSNPQGGQQQQDPSVSPLSWDTEISYPLEETEETYFRDVAGAPLATSAGEALDATPPRQRSWLVIQVKETIAESEFNPLDLAELATTINSNAVTIEGTTYPARTLLLSAPQASAKKTWTDGVTTITYREITYRIRHNPETWDQFLEDRGFKELKSGKLVDILDGDGQTVTKSYPLSGGVALSDPTSPPAILERRPYKAATWAGFIG